MQTLLGVLGVLFGAGQFVVSLMDLNRGHAVIRSDTRAHPAANLLIRRRERQAVQAMLIGSVTVALGAAALLFAQQHYVAFPRSTDSFRESVATYDRQHALAIVCVVLSGIAVLATLFAWFRWSQVPVWPREMFLAAALVVIAGLTILAVWDLPVLTQARPDHISGLAPSASSR